MVTIRSRVLGRAFFHRQFPALLPMAPRAALVTGGHMRLPQIARSFSTESKATELELKDLKREVASLRETVQKLALLLESEHTGRHGAAWEQESKNENFWGPDGGPDSFDGHIRHKEVRPSKESARLQPTHISELDHLTIAHLALMDNHFAKRERLLREIMVVNQCSWEKAHDVLCEMDEYKEHVYWPVTLPYRIGITVSFFAGVFSILLCFYKPVAHWYGVNIVGEELPEEHPDINTMTTNQVGSWTWTWMEPMIGVASFVLLCAQFMRTHLLKVNMKSWLAIVESLKADRLAKKFPQYDRSIVREWAKPLPRCRPNFYPSYERSTGLRGPSSGL